jgi:biotin carboxyl carrier protein
MNITLHINGKPVVLENVERKAQEIAFKLAGKTYRFRGHRSSCVDCVLERDIADGIRQRISGISYKTKGERRVQLGALEAGITELPKAALQAAGVAALSPVAPMPGLVRKIMVKKGDKVKQGQPLVIMEAMKLQTTLSAGGNGVVEAVLVKEGELVAEGMELVKVK